MNDRKGFGSNFGFLMAAVGSAVGLGNIWGFPNKMGANGGFPFLILYLALALCCGVIIMLGELALGRKTGHGAVGAYQSISKRFKWLGWLGIAAAALIFSFYSALGGYAYDDRWGRMTYRDFFKRRLIRLHPMVVMGMLIGAAAFYFGA